MEKNHSRKHKFTLYLSDDEDRILNVKYKMPNMRSKSTFLRHMIVYGALYDVDYKSRDGQVWKVQNAMLKKQPVIEQ